jgi:hypothetical protein
MCPGSRPSSLTVTKSTQDAVGRHRYPEDRNSLVDAGTGVGFAGCLIRIEKSTLPRIYDKTPAQNLRAASSEAALMFPLS